MKTRNCFISAAWLLCTLLLLLPGCSRETRAGTTTEEQNDFQRHRDVVYAVRGETELRLDLVVPTTGRGPYPTVLFLFGGGFKEGGKGTHSGDTVYAAQRGYVGVAAEYRLTEIMDDGSVKNQFPAALHDAKAAVRWLRQHAAEYSIDPDRIGASGISAGGNLALMLAVTKPEDGLEGDQGAYHYSSALQAVVAAAPQPDLSDPVLQTRPYNIDAMNRYLGGTFEEVPDRYRAASPVTYIDRTDSPALIIFGAQDPFVGMGQVRTTEEKVRSSYVDHTILIVAKGHHSYLELASPAEHFPMWDYFDTHLKGGGAVSPM